MHFVILLFAVCLRETALGLGPPHSGNTELTVRSSLRDEQAVLMDIQRYDGVAYIIIEL